jgi:flagellar L-ring protein FlgH
MKATNERHSREGGNPASYTTTNAGFRVALRLHGMTALVVMTAAMLSACSNTLDRLENINQQPPLTKSENPQAKPDYKPVSWPLPESTPPDTRYANSLWQPGARTFFRDQRAARVGDILTVRVEIDDRAELENETERKRDSKENVSAPKFFGLELFLGDITPAAPETDDLFDINGKNQNKGTGTIKRQDKIITNVAATITQVLPNGNLVVQGSQEIRVNFEVRELAVSGIIRPEDIDSSNTINSTQMAEARIVYGGRGQLMDAQQPRWGAQAVDILSPF